MVPLDTERMPKELSSHLYFIVNSKNHSLGSSLLQGLFLEIL